MELDITFLTDSDNFDLMDYSASCAEIGQNAGPETWNNSKESGIIFVKTPEEIQEAKDYIRSFGAWDDKEIQAWSLTELNALILQFISGDLREYLWAKELPADEFTEWQENQGGRIGEGDDGKLYYSLGN